MSPRILVADDSSTMRKIIQRTIQAVGVFEVVEAKDGAEAVARFDQGGIDLILTDWNMPTMNGLQLIEQIRQRNTAVPIIMITTEAEKRNVLEAIRAGVSDYLVKPFEADALRAKLTKHIPVQA